MFDLSKVMQSAMEVKQSSDSEGGNNNSKYKLIYTLEGDIKVKLLFNPASGLVTRKIDRHSIGGTKVPCMSMYAQQCPVCKQVETIQNTKGLDLWKLKKITRGIAFAQYIESNYKWSKPEDQPKPGEIILLMFPWSVYKDINKIIAEAGAQAETVVATNTGRVVKISRYKEGNMTKYSATVDAWAQPYTTCQGGDQEFEQLLSGMESLNDKICPVQITDDIVKQCKEMSDSLYREYLAGNVETNVPQQQAPAGNFGNFTPQQPNNFSNFAPQQPGGNMNNFQPQQPQGANVPPNAPKCFGCHNQCDANKALLCPYEQLCKQQGN